MSWLEGCQKRDEIKWLDGGHDKSGAEKKRDCHTSMYMAFARWLRRAPSQILTSQFSRHLVFCSTVRYAEKCRAVVRSPFIHIET